MISYYPSITQEEFKEGCLATEQSFLSRQDNGNFTDIRFDGQGLYLRQNRETLELQEDIIDPSEHELLDQDPESLTRQTQSNSFEVMFSVVLSPTYQVPVLWFTLLQANVPIMSFDKVYEILVSRASRDALRQVGVIGGISMAHHPLSNTPAFFIHPCRTPEILELVRPDNMISPFEYLLLWLGIIGPSVGLHLASTVVASHESNQRPEPLP